MSGKLLVVGPMISVYLKSLLPELDREVYIGGLPNTNHSIPQKYGWVETGNIKFASRESVTNFDGYDLVHIHQVHEGTALHAKKAKRVVMSCWGRTILDDPELYDHVLVVTFSNPVIRDEFVERYGPEKARLVKWVLPVFEHLDKLDKEECKKELGLDGTIVALGHKITPATNQEGILKSLQGAYPGVTFLVPMHYGTSKKVEKRIREVLKDFGHPYKILTDFLPPEQVAKLRKAVDIMIMCPPKDHMSASVAEHLAAGSLVIAGRWLPYDAYDSFMLRVKSLDDLSDTLDHALKTDYSKELSGNRKILDRYSKQKAVDCWNNFYREFL